MKLTLTPGPHYGNVLTIWMSIFRSESSSRNSMNLALTLGLIKNLQESPNFSCIDGFCLRYGVLLYFLLILSDIVRYCQILSDIFRYCQISYYLIVCYSLLSIVRYCQIYFCVFVDISI